MASYKSEILIDDESVWSTEDSVDKQTVQIDVSRFTGRKELKFRMTKTGGDAPGPGPTPPSGPFNNHPTLTNDLILHYSMEDNAANKNVIDDTPNAYDGTSNRNTNLMNDPNGIINDCFLMNGINDLITLPDISGEFGDEASVCFWLKLDASPPAFGNNTGLCDLGTSAHPFVTAYPWTDNNFYNRIFRNDRIVINLAGGVVETNWHLLTITQKPGANGYVVYQNANPIFTGAGEPTAFIPAVQLLGRSNSEPPGPPTNYFTGRMDQVGIWSRSLLIGEIIDYFNGGAGLPY